MDDLALGRVRVVHALCLSLPADEIDRANAAL
jgi:hypothetical protein